MTAQEAAQLFAEGKREKCREWCLFPSIGEYAIRRTAAVALELDAKDNKRAIGAGLARSFLRMMAGEESA